jgi:hypothetical protein
MSLEPLICRSGNLLVPKTSGNLMVPFFGKYKHPEFFLRKFFSGVNTGSCVRSTGDGRNLAVRFILLRLWHQNIR